MTLMFFYYLVHAIVIFAFYFKALDNLKLDNNIRNKNFLLSTIFYFNL